MRAAVGRFTRAAAAGAGATVMMDVAAEILRRTRGTRSLDYALVGRWVGHMTHGRFRHQAIGTAVPVRHEKAIGWTAHYSIGTAFAIALATAAPEWVDDPTPLPAIALGVGSVAAPWLVMQPAFGMGVAASKTPNPTQARLGSLRAHTIYGIGLWLSGLALANRRRGGR